MKNRSIPCYFSLLSLSNDPQLQIFLFFSFFFIYLLTLVGNTMIILAVRISPHLHSPMYFFLGHLSFLDMCFSSATTPKLLETIITDQKTISFMGCFTQVFIILLSATSEVFLLSAMAYDRYSAICKPLHYVEMVNLPFCRKLVASAWAIGFFYALANTLLLFKLHFCGPNIIKHFSCELPSLLSLSCNDIFMNQMFFFISGSAVGLISLFLTVLSYIHIISTILKMNSPEGKHKAFSTCGSHLSVVVLFYGTGYFRYLRPNSTSSLLLDEIFSIQYSILTPLLNPIIYSLQNKEVKTAFRKILKINFGI